MRIKVIILFFLSILVTELVYDVTNLVSNEIGLEELFKDTKEGEEKEFDYSHSFNTALLLKARQLKTESHFDEYFFHFLKVSLEIQDPPPEHL